MIRKGDIYYCNLGNVNGSEQGGTRPVIIVQNNRGNIYSPTIVIVPITKLENNKKDIPVHVVIRKNKYIKEDSIALIEQIRTIDKKRLIKYIGKIEKDILKKIDLAIKKELDLEV